MEMKESRFPAPACGGRRLHSTACQERTAPLVPLAALDLPNRGRRVAFGSKKLTRKGFTRAAAILVALLLGALPAAMLQAASPKDKSAGDTGRTSFVSVKDRKFFDNGAPYCYVGANFWFGAYLGADAAYGDPDRLRTELDLMKEYGISNVRVLGASEDSPLDNSLKNTFRGPSADYNETLLRGLDVLLDELGKRNMKAVIYLNNFWEWSGGMATYLYWTNGGEFINMGDPAHPWPAFAEFAAGFYESEPAIALFRDYVRHIVSRTNSVNGLPYREDPTIMAWQLANEPRPGHRDGRGFARLPAYNTWVDSTAALIKSIDPNHLVSTGSEGTKGCLEDEPCFLDAHASKNIDYLTFHMWPKNWGWFDTANPDDTFAPAMQKARDYMSSHLELAMKLDKPIVLEEFGLDRDGGEFAAEAPTTLRDRFYGIVFDQVESSLGSDGPLRGTNFWAWGGHGRAEHEDYLWREDDRSYTGDPPQEPQGLYSVFNSDASTLEKVRRHADRLAGTGCGPAIEQ